MGSGSLAGKRVLVTGASRGIGLAVADGFMQEGADLTILASSDEVRNAASTLEEKHGRAVEAIQVDITNRESVMASLAEGERIDVLVNNAGLERSTPIDDLTDQIADDFKRIIDINVLGTYYVTRAALPRMEQGGRIILTSSIWGKIAVPEFGAYCASKHANIGFMRSLAKELGPRGITVNAVCPGWVRTDPAMKSLRFMAEKLGQSEEAVLDEIVANQAMSGLMDPQDVVAPYLFLASDMANSITGQALNVDRGEVML